MVVENYDLQSLRQRMSEEFGIDIVNEADNITTLDKRINDAIAWLGARKKNWPFLEVNANIDVGELSTATSGARYGAGLLHRMQRQITECYFNLTAIGKREFVDFAGDGSSGIMATAYAAQQITLERAYIGSDRSGCAVTNITSTNPMVVTVTLTDSDGESIELPSNTTFPVVLSGHTVATGLDPDGTHQATWVATNQFSIPLDGTSGPLSVNVYGTAKIGKEFVIAQGCFECPENFVIAETLHQDIETDWDLIRFRATHVFEREIRANKVIQNINRIYTVKPDPLSEVDNKFLFIYPYFTDRNVLHLKYYRCVEKLIADSDVPDIPIGDRFAVLYATGWFVAQWQKDTEMVSFYRAGALNELERMKKDYQLADDTSEDEDVRDDPTGPIQGSGSLPEFELD